MANIYDMSDTWNDGVTTFTAIKMNVTDTASASGSLLMDLRVGGLSQLHVSKDGNLTVGNPSGGGSLRITSSGGVQPLLSRFYLTGGLVLGATSGSPPIYILQSDLAIARDAANTLAQRNGTNAQTFNLYNTYTDASNYERACLQWSGNEIRIGTEAAGTGSIRSVGLYIGGTRYQIIGSNFNQFDKNLYMNGANIVTGGAGFKIGTAANQPIGFWNATPVVQPTTGISAGSFVANTSGIINDTATFDGYTIGQVVAALRQIGLLA